LDIFKTLQKVFRFHPRNPSYWAQKFWGGVESKSGVQVNEETAMKYTAYYSGVRIISETIAALPLNVYKRNSDGGKQKSTDHPLYSLLHDQPNEDMDSFTWRETAKAHILGWGNHYSLLKKNPLKRYVEEIYPLEPWRVRPEMVLTSMGRIKVYRYMPEEGPELVLNKDNILHIHGLSYNGLVGLSPLEWYREAIGLGLAMEEFGSRFFSNGLNADGIFTTPQVLKQETYDRLKEELKKNYVGLGKAHSTMLLEQDLKFNQLSINPNDAQLLESKNFQIQEIARILRIPLYLLASPEPVSDNNIEHLGIGFVVNCLLPYLVRDEQAYNMQLFPESEKKSYYTKYVVDGLLRGDTATRWEAYTKGFNTGALSPNDILEMEDKNPFEGGDRHFIQLNMQSIEDIGKLTSGAREIRAKVSQNLIEKLGKAYKPLFKSALIRIIKSERTHILKILKTYSQKLDIELLKNDLKNYYESHKEFVNTQIKPTIYVFSEALFAEIEGKDIDITIFADSYNEDFIERYIDGNLKELNSITGDDFISQVEEKLNDWEENKPEELSSIEIIRITKAFNKYIEKIAI